jgi:hypothetical protein
MHLQKTKYYALREKHGSTTFTLKYLLLCLCFSLFVVLAEAQQQTPKRPVQLNPLKDKLEYQGFTVRLIPTMDGYYGFDIFKTGKLVLHQTENPLPAFGITERADAFITAKWMINEYRNTGHFPRVFPPGFEKQFQVSQPVNPSNHN